MEPLLVESNEYEEAIDDSNVPSLKVLWQPFEIQGVTFIPRESEKARIKEWREEYLKRYGNTPPRDVFANVDSHDDIGVFHLAHPLPARVLMAFVDTCHNLDQAIRVSLSIYAPPELRRLSRNMDPFQYLKSEEVVAIWRSTFEEYLVDFSSSGPDGPSAEVTFRGMLRASRSIIGMEMFLMLSIMWSLSYSEEDSWIEKLPPGVIACMARRASLTYTFLADFKDVLSLDLKAEKASIESKGLY